MIDWVTFKAFVRHRLIDGGGVVSYNQAGAEEWHVLKRLPVQGSYDSTIQIRTEMSSAQDGFGSILWVSGNLVKFLQGHSLFGTSDLRGLVEATMHRLFELFPDHLMPSETDLVMLQNGLYYLSRVDVTKNLRLDTREDVRLWIRAAKVVARGRRQAANLEHEGTLYLGQKSRRKTIKVYCKGDEMEVKGHKLPEALPVEVRERLHLYGDTILRSELTLRGQSLTNKGLELGRNWRYDTPEELYSKEIGALELPENVPFTSKSDVEGLPARLVAVYKLWQQGEDLRVIYPKPTFYRYRSALLAHGIDISAPVRQVQTSNVVPLWRYLVAEEAGVPEWAKGTPLYFDPPGRQAEAL